ncbi:hypothetical protein ACJX0J_013222, partial [Zea mays]
IQARDRIDTLIEQLEVESKRKKNIMQQSHIFQVFLEQETLDGFFIILKHEILPIIYLNFNKNVFMFRGGARRVSMSSKDKIIFSNHTIVEKYILHTMKVQSPKSEEKSNKVWINSRTIPIDWHATPISTI